MLSDIIFTVGVTVFSSSSVSVGRVRQLRRARKYTPVRASARACYPGVLPFMTVVMGSPSWWRMRPPCPLYLIFLRIVVVVFITVH